jgi:hypothetical protein
MIIDGRWLRGLVAIGTAALVCMSAVIVFGYVIPLLVLKIRFGFGDDDIPVGYGFDGLLILAIAFGIGVIATLWLSAALYRRLSPRA